MAGLNVVEFAGIGPTPFAGMLLADLGADVIRIDRPGYVNPANPVSSANDVINRGRSSVAVDLKSPEGLAVALELVSKADALIEGFRPGVMERLGLSPDDCLALQPALVYGRMTGWGQSGPLAHTAGHDINYVAVGGALEAIGTIDRPVPPLNLVGDFGGGSMLLALGMLAAVLESRSSGKGQVVDAAVTDGAALLMSMFYGFDAEQIWQAPRGGNLLDGGTHYYNVYRCADDRWLSVGAIEPAFYQALIHGLGVADDPEFQRGQSSPELWPTLIERTGAVIRTRPRDEWAELFEGTDACVAPVLARQELATHPYAVERGMLVEIDGVRQPAPAPRFSRTPLATPAAPSGPGQDSREALARWGVPTSRIDHAVQTGAVYESGARSRDSAVAL